MAGRLTAFELADRVWEELLEDQPLLGTMVGDERHDDRLPDLVEAGPRDHLPRAPRATGTATTTRSGRSPSPCPSPKVPEPADRGTRATGPRRCEGDTSEGGASR